MRKILIPIFILILLTGCGSRPDAGIKLADDSCITTNRVGECTYQFSSVSKNNTFYFDTIVLEPDETVYLELTISITSGELQIGLINYGGELVNYSINPDNKLEVKLWVLGDDSGYLPIQFNALNNRIVENVSISLTYTRR